MQMREKNFAAIMRESINLAKVPSIKLACLINEPEVADNGRVMRHLCVIF